MGNIIYSKGQTFGGAPPASPTPPGSTDCLDFDGTVNEILADNDEKTMGLVDNWTWMLWVKKEEAYSQQQHVFRCTAPGEGNNNTIRIAGATGGNDNRLNLIVYADDGNNRNFVVADYFTGLNDTWIQIVVTWDGPLDLKLFKNTTDVTPTVGGVGGAQTDTGRIIRMGYTWPGRFYGMAFWSTTMDQDNITAINNSGDGTSFDLGSDSGNYDRSSSLQHWWVFGTDQTSESAIGTDYGLGNKFNLMDNNTGITIADDIVADSPT